MSIPSSSQTFRVLEHIVRNLNSYKQMHFCAFFTFFSQLIQSGETYFSWLVRAKTRIFGFLNLNPWLIVMIRIFLGDYNPRSKSQTYKTSNLKWFFSLSSLAWVYCSARFKLLEWYCNRCDFWNRLYRCVWLVLIIARSGRQFG